MWYATQIIICKIWKNLKYLAECYIIAIYYDTYQILTLMAIDNLFQREALTKH